MGAESPLAPWVASGAHVARRPRRAAAVGRGRAGRPRGVDVGAARRAPRRRGGSTTRGSRRTRSPPTPASSRAKASRARPLGALATAFSRSVIVRKDGFDLPALCPLLDLANHADDAPPGAAPRLYGAKSGGLRQGDGGGGRARRDDRAARGRARWRCATAARRRRSCSIDYGFAPKRPEPAVSLAWTIEETDANYYDKLDVVEAAVKLAETSRSCCARARRRPAAVSASCGSPPPLQGIDAFLLESIFRQVLWPEHLQLPVTENNERAALAGRPRPLRRRARRAERRPAARPRDPRRGGAGLARRRARVDPLRRAPRAERRAVVRRAARAAGVVGRVLPGAPAALAQPRPDRDRRGPRRAPRRRPRVLG